VIHDPRYLEQEAVGSRQKMDGKQLMALRKSLL
jgi:hypothetical protein